MSIVVGTMEVQRETISNVFNYEEVSRSCGQFLCSKNSDMHMFPKDCAALNSFNYSTVEAL